MYNIDNIKIFFYGNVNSLLRTNLDKPLICYFMKNQEY